MAEIEVAPDDIEYDCPNCGETDTVTRDYRWKSIYCDACGAIILNEDIDRL